MISRETIDRIFETARIEEVIGDFVTLKKAGAGLKGLSPFSNEKTPSFIVSPSKQIFKDFSSGKGGNVVSFLMEHEHYSYPEALRYLAKKYGIEVEETGQTDEEKEARSEKESLYLVNEFANQYFQQILWENEEGKNIGLSYFKERGFSEETLKTFQLGYSPEKWDALTQAALSESYTLEFLEKSGLTKVNGEQKTDRFRARVIFPILSHTGRVLGFGGRTLKKDAKIAKYLNSPESEIYHKSKTLYGIFQAKQHLSKEDSCLLVEGYTDVISLSQAGVKNVVASSGTALTKDQINLVKRYTKNITILYDGDPAGIKASLRGIDLVLEEGMNVRVLLFPDGEDPDSFSKRVSPIELKEYIEDNKTDFLRFKSSLLLKEAGDNPLERSNVAREIVQSIAIIPDALQRDAYIKECAHILQMDERVLFTELAQIRKGNHKKEETQRRREEAKAEPVMQVVEKSTTVNIAKFYEQEKALCWLLLNYGHKHYAFNELEESEDSERESVAEYIIFSLQEDELEFENVTFSKIYDHFIEQYNETGQMPDEQYFFKLNDGELMHAVVDLVTEKYELHNWESRKIHPPEKDAFIKTYTEQSVLRFKEKKIGHMITGFQSQLKSKEQSSTEALEAIDRLTKLKILINKELKRVVN